MHWYNIQNVTGTLLFFSIEVTHALLVVCELVHRLTIQQKSINFET
jgi:hypothetical protein